MAANGEQFKPIFSAMLDKAKTDDGFIVNINHVRQPESYRYSFVSGDFDSAFSEDMTSNPPAYYPGRCSGSNPLSLVHALALQRPSGDVNCDEYAVMYLPEILSSVADINALGTTDADFTGKTPLHVALERGWESNVRALIEYGADIEVRNGRGSSAFHILAAGQLLPDEKENVLRLLIEKGGNVNAVAQEYTALDIADQPHIQNKDFANILCAVGAKRGIELDYREKVMGSAPQGRSAGF